MSKTTKKFGFRVVKIHKTDDLPFNPYIEMVLSSWSSADGEDAPILSPQLMTEAEIDAHAKALSDDLAAWAKAAKAALRQAKEQTTAIIRARA